MTRDEITKHIENRLRSELLSLKRQFSSESAPYTRHAYIDDLLPEAVCQEINRAFPAIEEMKFASNFREQKHVTRSEKLITNILSDITFALQAPEILDVFAELTDIKKLEPDPNLYGSGLSSMIKGDYLNPHLDNSHDQTRKKRRVLNALLYVTPDWEPNQGGNLELWDRKVKSRKEILSKFNRLALMETNKTSFHSVSEVTKDRRRNCVSNYYFVDDPESKFHISTFKARPENTLDKIRFPIDTFLRKGLRRIFPNGVFVPDTFRQENSASKNSILTKTGKLIREVFLYKN